MSSQYGRDVTTACNNDFHLTYATKMLTKKFKFVISTHVIRLLACSHLKLHIPKQESHMLHPLILDWVTERHGRLKERQQRISLYLERGSFCQTLPPYLCSINLRASYSKPQIIKVVLTGPLGKVLCLLPSLYPNRDLCPYELDYSYIFVLQLQTVN